MRKSMRGIAAVLAVLALLASACGDDAEPEAAGDATANDEAPDEMADDEMSDVAMAPASVVAEAQDSDGTSVVVASVTLPSAGFIVVHGDGGGSPGAVIGHSALLPAGESVDVVIVLDEPLAGSGVVFPMAHIDVDGDGAYGFFPPDDTTDAPALTESGDVAVVPAEITIS